MKMPRLTQAASASLNYRLQKICPTWADLGTFGEVSPTAFLPDLEGCICHSPSVDLPVWRMHPLDFFHPRCWRCMAWEGIASLWYMCHGLLTLRAPWLWRCCDTPSSAWLKSCFFDRTTNLFFSFSFIPGTCCLQTVTDGGRHLWEPWCPWVSTKVIPFPISGWWGSVLCCINNTLLMSSYQRSVENSHKGYQLLCFDPATCS